MQRIIEDSRKGWKKPPTFRTEKAVVNKGEKKRESFCLAGRTRSVGRDAPVVNFSYLEKEKKIIKHV